MLKRLSIDNYALIRDLELDPADHLNIITGETGAGKSIMLGAVGLLLGQRADSKVLADPDKKCVVEAEFDIGEYNLAEFFGSHDLDYDPEVIIRREIRANGKSRAFVNDSPSTLDVLKELGRHLMDIHSQHDTTLLGSPDFQLTLLDQYGGSGELASRFKAAFEEFRKSQKAFEDLREEEGRIRKEADYDQFLFQELEKASLEQGEQESLEGELEILENAEDIKAHLNQFLAALSRSEYSTVTSMEATLQELKSVRSFSKKLNELFERLESLAIELADINREAERIEDEVEYDPSRIEEAKDRLSLIYQLQQKHQKNTISELLEIQKELDEKVQRFDSLDEEVARAKEVMKASEEKALNLAEELSQVRLKTIKPFCGEIMELLANLSMENAKLEVSHTPVDLHRNGVDEMQILFSANKGVAPESLKKVASGGEFSRLMFCVKYALAGKTSLPTIVFDEIDSGVSGEVALKLGTMMRRMSEEHQVIAISHLPQIAAKAERHYYVYKEDGEDKTISKIRLLSEEERVTEVAKMISGEKVTESALNSAKELILS